MQNKTKNPSAFYHWKVLSPHSIVFQSYTETTKPPDMAVAFNMNAKNTSTKNTV